MSTPLTISEIESVLRMRQAELERMVSDARRNIKEAHLLGDMLTAVYLDMPPSARNKVNREGSEVYDSLQEEHLWRVYDSRRDHEEATRMERVNPSYVTAYRNALRDCQTLRAEGIKSLGEHPSPGRLVDCGHAAVVVERAMTSLKSRKDQGLEFKVEI